MGKERRRGHSLKKAKATKTISVGGNGGRGSNYDGRRPFGDGGQ